MIRGFSPAEVSALLNLPVLTEHAQEAAFLWLQRERASAAPHYRLKHLALLDERVRAHLAALRLAGPTGLKLARRQLGELDGGSLFVAAWLAFGLTDREAMGDALAIAGADAALTASLVHALAWHDLAMLRPALDRLAVSPRPAHRALALAVRVAHRERAGDAVAQALTDADPALRAQALCAVGTLGLAPLRHAVESAVESTSADPDPACRFWAHWTCAVAGHAGAAQRAYDTGEAASQPAAALEIAMRAGPIDWARALVRRLAADAATQRLAVLAAGDLGDPAVAPWLLQLCEDDVLGRAAAEAFAQMTGVDLEEPQFRRDAPDPSADRPSDAAHPDAGHPDDREARWSGADALRGWWQQERHRFRSGVRHLGGQPVGEAAAVQVLRTGTQRQRHGAALELLRLHPETVLFPVTAPAELQRRRLAA
jgi:uncharacterized protein (TIGR02270 family)